MISNIKKNQIGKVFSTVILGICILVVVIISISLVSKARAVGSKQDILSAAALSTKDKPGYTVYWDKSKGTAKLERREGEGEWMLISDSNSFGYFVDYVAKADADYTYRLTRNGTTLVTSAGKNLGGKPIIAGIEVRPGVTGKVEASAIVTFKTDRPAKSQVYYGENVIYSGQTNLSPYLNQSHTVVIEKLKPETTYHFKVRSTDKTGVDSSESSDQVFITPKPVSDKNILEVIFEALRNAFSGFDQWFRS